MPRYSKVEGPPALLKRVSTVCSVAPDDYASLLDSSEWNLVGDVVGIDNSLTCRKNFRHLLENATTRHHSSLVESYQSMHDIIDSLSEKVCELETCLDGTLSMLQCKLVDIEKPSCELADSSKEYGIALEAVRIYRDFEKLFTVSSEIIESARKGSLESCECVSKVRENLSSRLTRFVPAPVLAQDVLDATS